MSGAARYMKDERMATMEVATQDQTRLLQEYQGQLLVLLTQRNLHLDIPKEVRGIHNEDLDIHKGDLDIHKEDMGIHKEDLDILKEDLDIHKEDLDIHKEDLVILKQDLAIHKEDLDIYKEDQHIHKEDLHIHQVQEIFLAKNHFFLQATFHPVLLVVSITLMHNILSKIDA